MKIIKFDCNGKNAPAYGCSEPGDQSGYYIKVTQIQAFWLNRLNRGISINNIAKEFSERILEAIEKLEN